jgi:small-conductance mechanosensitive channel
LVYTFAVDTPVARWIGYPIVLGFGFGFGFHQAIVAVQATLPMRDIATGVAIVFSTPWVEATVRVQAAIEDKTQGLDSSYKPIPSATVSEVKEMTVC